MIDSGKISKFWLVLIIAQLSMIGPFTVDTYLPSFPSIEAEFQISRALLNQSLGFYLVAFGISTLVWGSVADRFGRKFVIAFGTFMFALSSLGCGLAANFSQFLIFRIAQGFFASGGMVAGRAIVRDLFDSKESQKVMSQVIMFFALAPAVAPILGGWLHDTFGWRSVFYFLMIYSITSMFIFIAIVPETLAPENRQSLHPVKLFRLYAATFKNMKFQASSFAIGSAFGGLFLYIAGAPTVVFDILHLGADDFARQFIPMVSGLVLGSFISSKLSHRLSSLQLVSLAMATLLFSAILNFLQWAFLQPGVFVVVTPLVILAMGIGLFLPAMTVIGLDCFPKSRGTASAIQGFIQTAFNAIIASIILPFLGKESINFITMQAIFWLLTALFWWYLINREKRELKMDDSME